MHILIVEDEQDVAGPVVKLLRHERYEVVWSRSITEAYRALEDGEFDLVVLDIMLPEGEDAGFEFAKELRDADFGGPILFVTARDLVEDRVRGLDLGGDDYLVKPFSLSELLARVRALLRRLAETKRSVLERGPLKMDFGKRRVYWQEQEVALTEREFAMLELFALYPERIFAAQELLDRFFPEADSGPHVVRVYVSQLRHKTAPELILTVPGGYRLGAS